MHQKDILEELIRTALAEDIGQGDFTTLAIVDKDKNGQAKIIAKQNGVLAGIEMVKKIFFPLDHDIQFKTQFKNGDKIDVNDTVIIITGKISSILQGERTVLNLLAHLSGISTLTAKYVEGVRGTQAKITDTRKTTPLLRVLEKEAVRAGGGINHRMGLYDMILIKDNHIQAAGGIREAVDKCKQYLGEKKLNLKIEVETTNLNQVRDALACDVDRIMLDNMALNMIREAVNIISGRAVVEASGGVSLTSIRSIAETGVDLISIGALTHSAPVFDFSLLLEGA